LEHVVRNGFVLAPDWVAGQTDQTVILPDNPAGPVKKYDRTVSETQVLFQDQQQTPESVPLVERCAEGRDSGVQRLQHCVVFVSRKTWFGKCN